MEQDLFSGHAVTSARDLREIFRKIFVGEREHSRFLTAFSEAIFFADSKNFYALAPSALLLIDRYPILASYPTRSSMSTTQKHNSKPTASAASASNPT
jgi:hypothetical protein